MNHDGKLCELLVQIREHTHRDTKPGVFALLGACADLTARSRAEFFQVGNEQGGRRGSKATLGLDRDVLILDSELGDTGEHIRPRNIQICAFRVTQILLQLKAVK